MKISVSFNASQAIKQIKFWQLDKLKKMRDEIILTSLEIVTDAKKKLTSDGHVDTGRLRSSIDILARRSDGLGTEIGTRVKYASKIESLDSYLFFAHEINRQGFLRRIGKIIKG